MYKLILKASFLIALLATATTTTAQSAKNHAPATEKAKSTLSETEKIERLISYVSNLQGATFIRNGSRHSPKEAAKHLHTKFNKHHDKIKTAPEFIKHLATKSSSSGEYYKIEMADGSTLETYKVLSQELARLEKESQVPHE